MGSTLSYSAVLSYLDNLPVFCPDDILAQKQIMALDSLLELLKRLGNPQERLKYIHVGGTNGKGSTCAFIRQILMEAGLSVGSFNSPELIDFREQITINSQMISKDDIAAELSVIKDKIDGMVKDGIRPPSRFEILVAAAVLYFNHQKCDIVIMEVGLGGRDDATNVIPAPLVTVLTAIGPDHTELLGDTVEEIAKVKSGIIKPGTHLVLYPQLPSVTKIISDVCSRHKVPMTIAKLRDDLDISMAGSYQKHNASVALCAVEQLKEYGYNITSDAIKLGLKKAFWPARFEIVRKNPLFIIDGGHNVQCAKAVKCSLDENFPGMKFVLLIGVLKDKDYDDQIDILKDNCKFAICIAPKSARALPAAELALKCNSNGLLATACETLENGVALALSTGEPVLSYGSLYAAGYIKELVKKDM